MKYIINKQTGTAMETISVLCDIMRTIGKKRISNINGGHNIQVNITPIEDEE